MESDTVVNTRQHIPEYVLAQMPDYVPEYAGTCAGIRLPTIPEFEPEYSGTNCNNMPRN
jgi:hypothetical protein